MKKYPYWVRHNGIDYAPGTDVPVDETPVANATGGQATPPDSADKSVDLQEMTKEEFIKNTKGYNKTKLTELVEKYDVDIDVTNPENTNKIIHAKIVEKIYG